MAKVNGIKYKNVLVTGASSGIGREFAVQISRNSEAVYLVGRNEQELQKSAQLLKQENPSVQSHELICDLTSTQDRQDLISKLKDKEINLIIHAAGGGNFSLFIETDWEKEEKVIALNIKSPVHLTHGLLPSMLRSAKKAGTKCGLIFVSSHASFMRIPHFSVYASCKSFVNNYALTLVQELRDDPIDIMVTCPGATESKFSERAGLPKKMLSTPATANRVVSKTLKYLGKKNFVIISLFDQLIYWGSCFGPTALIDRLICLMQKRLLDKAKET